MTRWGEVLRLRRGVMQCLVEARKLAIYAGDRGTADYVQGAINRQRDRVRYAEKMARGGPGFLGFVGARFAAGDNRLHNQPARGSVDAG